MFIVAIQCINGFSFIFKFFIIKFFLKETIASLPKIHDITAWYILYASAEPQLNLKQTPAGNELNFRLNSILYLC